MNQPTIDSLIGNPDAFPILRRWHFFNHAGVAPLPHASADAMRTFADQAETDAYIGTGWYRDVEKLRASAARLINAAPEEVALLKNTSEGIATVAAGIDWSPGDRIVTTAVEYPANIYPWMEVRRRFGAELVMVPEVVAPDGSRQVPLDAILRELEHPRTRLLALSHVEFASGQRHDLAALGKVCRARGILLCVDAIQTVGVLPVDVKAMNIDYLSADGHKWMLGPEGAAIFYIRRDLLEQTRPLVVGWMNVINADDYGNYDYTLKPDARRYECGSWAIAPMLGLRASIDLLLGIGIDAVAERVKHLSDHLIERLRAKGYVVASPRGGAQWSGIVSFAPPGGQDAAALVNHLRRDHNVEIALREGRLRCSAHFYNTEAQLDRLVELLPHN